MDEDLVGRYIQAKKDMTFSYSGLDQSINGTIFIKKNDEFQVYAVVNAVDGSSKIIFVDNDKVKGIPIQYNQHEWVLQ